uniref:Laminin subunit alpha 3 n=1 Tax=Scophthalmus maximus TaxID=52904 RepID=A0A8D3CTJ2_SCOMX
MRQNESAPPTAEQRIASSDLCLTQADVRSPPLRESPRAREAVTGFSLSPPYFNLAEGSRISASATCGQDEAGTPRYDLYCKLVGGPNFVLPTQNSQGQFCDYCNSVDPSKARPVTNAIDGTERWWQSPPLSRGPGYNEVNVTLDLGQLFHVAYVLIKFANSPRPDLWVLERSVDNGRTFTPWQYFAHSKRECIERFGKQPNARILNDDDQRCMTEYSRIVPLENGEIVVSLVNGRPGSKNFTYSPVLRDFTKATNIRLHFLRTSTLLGHLISKAQRDPTVTRRYYYSIKDISIGGRCVCHGHAEVCGVLSLSFRLQCECQHNTCGDSCDRCCPGFNHKLWRAATVSNPNECQACQCFSHASDCYYDPEVEKRGASLDTFGRYDGGGVCINCQHNSAGVNCERCLEGFYRPYGIPPESPSGCIPCTCDERTAAGCEMGSGRCICKPQFAGENCDRCAEGYYYYPQCIRYPIYPTTTKSPAGPIVGKFKCICDYRGTGYRVCDASGRCLCRQGVEGERCNRCQPGYHSFPNCQACRCSPEGSHGNICNPLSGQCLCLPGVVGQQCDHCASGLRFPQCAGKHRGCNVAGTEVGSCQCLQNVGGTLCDRCKPLYWNLATDNPHGCIACRCDLKGTLSGVGECEQKRGQCHCKPNACGHSCDTCKDGFFLLQKKDYFGCQGCQCDVGGAIDTACDEISGRCRCRKNIVGLKCNEPAPSYYFPTLHQLKFEVEDGTTPNARPVRFGYNPQEFPDFSWQGYAVMSPAQSEVRVTVHVDPKEGTQHLFRVVLRFINTGSTSVTGSVKATNNRGTAGSDQSKDVIFPESRSPSFLTVPGEGFAEPFALTPGKWIFHIRAEGILLDYLVLLPSDYYEAPLLQEKITQPCTYLPTANSNTNCLLFKHVAMEGFSSALGTQGRLSSRSGRRRRQARVRRPTPDHPEMAALNGRQSQFQLSLRVPRSGPYTLVLEYASEVDAVQNVNILISGQPDVLIPARANIYSCAYSFLCRSVAVDSSNQVAALQLNHKTELLLQTSTTSFLLYKVYAVPAEEFSTVYVQPKVRHCVLRQFDKPISAWILYAARDGLLSSPRVVAPQREDDEDSRRRRQTRVFPVHEPHSAGILLKFPQVSEWGKKALVPLPGRYVVVVHYHQPEHTPFPVEVRVDAGRDWRGECVLRKSVDVFVEIVCFYLSLCFVSSYTPDLLKERPLDNSADFIQQCRGEGFYIDLRTSSQFCRDSARSLVAAYNDGALPCNCDESGSTGSTCDAVGGQCPCRQHIIGRQCTKCATGYYGFPYCRPCECGRRLCDEVTGSCICPPQTVKPACDVCQTQTFNYHPLLGCEGCECSPNGIKANAGPECERTTGQCSCKPRIAGRKCDRCAAGYYRFPDCLPCNCKQGGVTPEVCHPDTGRCLCKRNVAGVRCDTCREGSFYFDHSNSHGCTSCFCFGATDKCQSSSKRRGKSVEMRGWRLIRPDQEEVPSVLNTASNTVVSDIQELPPTVQTLHWVAPQSYLGDRVTSYGGFLTYQSKSFGIPSEGMTLMDRRPDVVLTGRNMTLIHMAPHVPLPDRLYQGRVHLVEGNWRHAVTNRPVTREEFMMVLAGLVGLRIQALYFTQSQRLSLGEVGLEEATNTGAGGPGNTVEHCSCPPQYTGDSCEKCAPGFYRDGSRPFLGHCVPCECNGLSDECEEKSGRCLKCQYNTAGDQCEHCKEGYYGNAAQRTCRVCPCPFGVPTNSFAIGCREVFGDIRCVCRLGYAGEKCERCAPGYYGDPLTPGGSCKPCNCNGNGNNCDPRTGVCKNTLEPGDTNTDEHCQECDSCAQTLLHDLEKLDDELGRIKGQLDNATASASSQDKLKSLEKAMSDTKVTCHSPETLFSSSEPNYLVVLNLCFCVFEALLNQLKMVESSGDMVPNANLAKMLEEAQRMVKEMENRNFIPQKTAAEKERDEAKKCTRLNLSEKNSVNSKWRANQNTEVKIRGLLKAHEAKLKDLDKALKEATDLVMKANAENGLSAQALEELQEYEQLAAQLDGAKTDLTKKVNEISKAAAQEDIVKAAEDHAKNLSKLAKELEEYDASGRTEVRNAKDAIEAYKNITDAINAAEAAANEAKEAADNALNVSNISHFFFVKDLLNTIPSLDDKISEVENLTSHLSPISNISENIKKIKDLIEQARDAANRISIPMKFTGDGYVQMRPPKNLEDLKAFTSLSLSLQRPEGRGDGTRRRRQITQKDNMFVLYLGNRDSSQNYIGMVLKSNVLYGVYKLNGVEYQMKTEFFFLQFRIYQDAQMVLTKDITSSNPGEPILSNNQGEESKNLLDISPSDVVFYVGGYPDNFTLPVSMNFPKYKGCIEFSSVNDKVVSLYNFQQAENINLQTPCKRYVPITFRTDGSSMLDVYVEGNFFFRVDNKEVAKGKAAFSNGEFKEFYVGGAPQDLREIHNITIQPFKGCLKNLKVKNSAKTIDESVGISKVQECPMDSLVGHFPLHPKPSACLPHFSLDVRTRSPEGLLFFAATRGGRSHLALYMSKGRIRLSAGKQKEIFNREKYNDGKWHSVRGFKFRLVVDGIRAQDGQLTTTELTSMQQFMSPLYLGSVPESLHRQLKSKALPRQSVSGCIRNFKMNGALMSNPATNTGAGPCFEGPTQRGAYFSGNGAHVIISKYSRAIFSNDPHDFCQFLWQSVGIAAASSHGFAGCTVCVSATRANIFQVSSLLHNMNKHKVQCYCWDMFSIFDMTQRIPSQ